MIAHTTADVTVQPNTPTQILEWTSDGNSLVLGFMGTGTYSALFRLLVDGDPWYTYRTSVSDRTAYVADRGAQIPAGKVVEIQVTTDSSTAEMFSGTILGGI